MAKPDDNKVLRVGGVPEHFNLPWKLASDDFAAQGVQVDFSEYPGGTGAMNRALRDGDLDMAVVLTAGGVADVVNHGACRLVKVYVASPLLWGIHVAAGSDIQRIEDIGGRRYAISRPGSGSHLTAIVDAALRGWPTDDMRFVTVGDLTGARAALGRAEAEVFFWERFTTQPYVDNGEFRRIGERETPWPAFVIVARNDVIAERAHDLRRVLHLINVQCCDLMLRRDAVALIAERYALARSEVAAWLAKTTWSTDFARPDAALARVLQALRPLSLIERTDVEPESIWQRLD